MEHRKGDLKDGDSELVRVATALIFISARIGGLKDDRAMGYSLLGDWLASGKAAECSPVPADPDPVSPTHRLGHPPQYVVVQSPVPS